MDVEQLERNVNTSYGVFHFELVEYPGPAPLVDIWLDTTHIGYADYINLKEASDLDLLIAANCPRIPAKGFDDENDF